MDLHSSIPNPSSAYHTQWSYSDTEWWGWFILITTWSVFVVGMGSCLDLWDWGSRNSIHQDDESWPVRGYYPVLIVLTGVMAWIWVFIAWVGMKYFRHAKM